jgi:hypothetical protein
MLHTTLIIKINEERIYWTNRSCIYLYTYFLYLYYIYIYKIYLYFNRRVGQKEF